LAGAAIGRPGGAAQVPIQRAGAACALVAANAMMAMVWAQMIAKSRMALVPPNAAAAFSLDRRHVTFR
jgi:hypothetical protein